VIERKQTGLHANEVGSARIPVLVVSFVLMASLALVALDRLLLPARFAIDEVIVSGDAPNVDPAAVLKAVRGLGPRSWFSVDLGEVEAVVKRVPWVHESSVRRRWPGKLVVTVSQARPFARYNDTGWINQQGERLKLPPGFDDARLPRLYGPAGREGEVAKRYLELAPLFDGIADASLRSVSLGARGSWQMGIAVGGGERVIEVAIGREALERRVSRLAASLVGAFGKQLDGIAAIDLRYPNGFAVRSIPAAGDGGHVAKEAHADRVKRPGEPG
jgi:cell division protein FtsQ